jgi:hypothetical protein
MNAPTPLLAPAVTGPSDALARAMAAGARPLHPATRICAACGATTQIAAPAPVPCRGCDAGTIPATA